MKNYTFIILSALLLISINSYSQTKNIRILNDFDKIDIWGNFKIEMIQADSNAIIIDSKIVPYDEIVSEIKNGVLKIRTKSNLFKETTINIKINYKSIIKVKANASTELNFLNSIVQDKIKIEAIGGARVILTVNLKNADLTAYQGGHIDIKGKAVSASIFANSGGIISATNLLIDEAKVKLNTGGQAEITVNKKLVARANTKSRLSYFGKPETEEIKASLGATISKWDE
ncbi:MAG: head GIN domain-containing protein [Bacteroidales bacterium]